jgi:hypothetical protein
MIEITPCPKCGIGMEPKLLAGHVDNCMTQEEFAAGKRPVVVPCPLCGTHMAPRRLASHLSIGNCMAQEELAVDRGMVTGRRTVAGHRPWRGLAWLIIGGFALFFAGVGYWAPGIVFTGSVTHVNALCSEPLFSHMSACGTATTATTVIAILAGFGLAAVIRGTWRMYHNR